MSSTFHLSDSSHRVSKSRVVIHVTLRASGRQRKEGLHTLLPPFCQIPTYVKHDALVSATRNDNYVLYKMMFSVGVIFLFSLESSFNNTIQNSYLNFTKVFATAWIVFVFIKYFSWTSSVVNSAHILSCWFYARKIYSVCILCIDLNYIFMWICYLK